MKAIMGALNPEGTREWNLKQGLPAGTTREYEDGYEVVTVPAKFRDESKLPSRVVLADSMDKTCIKGFKNIPTLNPMQSTVFQAAFKTQENLLICAPTGESTRMLLFVYILRYELQRNFLRSQYNLTSNLLRLQAPERPMSPCSPSSHTSETRA